MHEVRNGRPVAHLLEVISATVRGVGLVGLAEDRVERLVPVVGRLQVGNAARDDHLHAFDRIDALRRQSIKTRADRAHRRYRLQYAVMVHGLDRQTDRGQIEVAPHYLRTNLPYERLECATEFRDHLLVLESEATLTVAHLRPVIVTQCGRAELQDLALRLCHFPSLDLLLFLLVALNKLFVCGSEDRRAV